MAILDTVRDAIMGNPPSVATMPSREGVIKAFEEFYAYVGGIVAGFTSYETKALMDAVVDADDGTQARVWGDPTPANNAIWISNGGVWSKDTDFYNQIAAVVQPLVDEAEAAQTAAELAASNAEGSVEDAQLLLDGLSSQIPAILGNDTGFIDVLWGLDVDGITRRLIEYVTIDGRRRGQIDAEALASAMVDGEDYIAFQYDPGDGMWQIKTQRKSDGQVFTLTTSGVCVDPKFSTDEEYVLFTWADAPEGTPKERYAPVEGGANYAVLPGKRLRRIGDSLTEFNTYGELYEQLGYNWKISDEGVAFRTPDQIAARVGAIDVLITVTGNSVPESSTVGVTALSTGNAQVDRGARPTVSPLLRQAGSLPFTWNGKAFLLKTTNGADYTVEQVDGDGAVSFPAATAVRIDQEGREDYAHLVWAVTNGGLTEPLDTQAQVAAIVANNKSLGKRTLVIGMLGSSDGGSNNPSANYTKLAQLNADLLATYGDNFIDPYKFFRGDAPYDGTEWPSALTLSELGAFSSQGQTDIANGTWPIDFASSPVDRLHFNELGYRTLDRLVALMVNAKGWNI